MKELRKYDKALYRKPRWLALNKVDLLAPAERDATAQRFLKRFGWEGKSFIISALTGEGCKELTYAIMEYLEEQNGGTAKDAKDAKESKTKIKTGRKARQSRHVKQQ